MDKATQPLQPEADTQVVEEAKAEKPKKEKVVEPDFVDRSLYDCDNCGGDGIVKNGANQDERCPQCLGKGRLN